MLFVENSFLNLNVLEQNVKQSRVWSPIFEYPRISTGTIYFLIRIVWPTKIWVCYMIENVWLQNISALPAEQI